MMRLQILTVAWTLMAAIGLTRCAAQQPPGGPPQPSPPIVTATRQNAFTIPFRIDATKTPAEQPVEAQLHLSTDQGATWTISSRVPPNKGSFVFRAPHDGEYWFSIRTVDAQGVTRPNGPMNPQLKVSVDTVAPRLDVSVTRGPAGEIVARWQAVDPNIKLGSFKLEYQATSAGPWEKVAVESPPSAMKHTMSGEATWWPSGSAGPILVRAEISDLAGNPAVTQAVVKPGEVSSPGGFSASSRGPQSPTAAADPNGWRPNDSPDDRTRWPPDRAQREPLSTERVPRAPAAASTSTTASTAVPSTLPQDAYAPESAPAGFPDAPSPAGYGDRTPTPVPKTEPTRTVATPVSQSTPGRPGSPLDFSILPAAVRPRMVASPDFELEYEIEAVGPSGVGKVELWGTRDGGRTWSDYAVDNDQQSPMPVSVQGEGIYGFSILVQSGSGFGGRPPAEGDLPDIWIGVDQTVPSCKITGTDVSPDGTELTVTWEASDDVLDPRPITILFSETAAGPWTPLASGLENTGSYRWKLDNRVPPRIVLRLEVRDEAGNVATCDTNEQITLDRHRPEGKIRGVRPVSKT
jgi:hypothetical protein